MTDITETKTTKDDILNELIQKRKKTVSHTKKLQYNDLKRLSKYIESSIFDKDECSIWNGYITNMNNFSKGVYINFYFKKKKVALHRLLFVNYIGPLSKDEYIKFTCNNKGKCCNINHFKKYKYLKKDSEKTPENKVVTTKNNQELELDFE